MGMFQTKYSRDLQHLLNEGEKDSENGFQTTRMQVDTRMMNAQFKARHAED